MGDDRSGLSMGFTRIAAAPVLLPAEGRQSWDSPALRQRRIYYLSQDRREYWGFSCPAAAPVLLPAEGRQSWDSPVMRRQENYKRSYGRKKKVPEITGRQKCPGIMIDYFNRAIGMN
jgi:hypothetical protein